MISTSKSLLYPLPRVVDDALYFVVANIPFSKDMFFKFLNYKRPEPVHEISNNLICATSKASDQPAHTRSLIRAFASRLSIL